MNLRRLLVCSYMLLVTAPARGQEAPAAPATEANPLGPEVGPAQPPRSLPAVPASPPPAPTAEPADERDAYDVEESDPGDPFGATSGDLGASFLTFRSLVQVRYASTFASRSTNERASYRVRENYLAQQGDGWAFNRLFLRVAADPVPYVGFKAIFDFAELIDNDPEDVVKQAYMTVRPLPRHVELMVGLFKLPFSTLELDPSARYELADFGQADDLVKSLGFAGSDLGAQLVVSPLPKPKRLRLSLGAFRGHAKDEHDSPVGAWGARIETKPTKSLRFGADMVDHPKGYVYDRPFDTSDKDVVPNPADPLYPAAKTWAKGRAFSVDARFKKKGFMARGEFMFGDRVDVDERYGAESFWAAWGLVAYRFRAGPVRLMPAARAEWLDGDREHGKGMRRALSFALTVLFLERMRFVLDVTRTDVEKNSPLLDQPKPLLDPPYLELDATRIVGQLQVEL